MTSPHNPFQQSTPPQPTARRLSPLLLLPLVIVLALGGVLIWQKDAIFGGQGGSTSTVAATSPTSPGTATSWVTDTVTADSPSPEAGGATEPSTTQIVVNTGGDADSINVSSLQKWASDVNNDNLTTLASKCWTFPESYIRERYLGNRERLAAIMALEPGGTQSGILWGTSMSRGLSDGDSAFVTWDEGDSDYACPQIELSGQPSITDDQVIHNVKRLILRDRGTPINVYDTQANYPVLVCTGPTKLVNNDIHNLDHADPHDITVTGHPTDTEWTVDSNGVEFSVKFQLHYLCTDTAN